MLLAVTGLLLLLVAFIGTKIRKRCILIDRLYGDEATEVSRMQFSRGRIVVGHVSPNVKLSPS